MTTGYIAEMDGLRFDVLPESMERYAAEGWKIYRLEEKAVKDVAAEAEKAIAASKHEEGHK